VCTTTTTKFQKYLYIKILIPTKHILIKILSNGMDRPKAAALYYLIASEFTGELGIIGFLKLKDVLSYRFSYDLAISLSDVVDQVVAEQRENKKKKMMMMMDEMDEAGTGTKWTSAPK
jgi:hypothetical protein